MKNNFLFGAFLALLFVIFYSATALAGQPEAWGLYLQDAATSSSERLHDFHYELMWIISGITLFVFLLLVYVCLRFNAKANPVPSKTTHNVTLEVLWTLIPVLILVFISVESFKVLYKNDKIAQPEMTLKIKGFQWYWGYEYPDQGGLAFDSRMIATADLKSGQVRLLSTDNPVVLPIETNIQILVTGNDVIHSWTVPAFGVKVDAIPGRTNESWFRINKVGTYFGQCSEICGKDHAFMPIEIKAVTKEEFAAWVEKAKVDFAANDNFAPIQLAQAQQQ